MNGTGITFVVFTKPWKIPLPELAAFVKGLGFDGIELPVRPGFQVEPQDVARKLPEAVRILGDLGGRSKVECYGKGRYHQACRNTALHCELFSPR